MVAIHAHEYQTVAASLGIVSIIHDCVVVIHPSFESYPPRSSTTMHHSPSDWVDIRENTEAKQPPYPTLRVGKQRDL